MNGTTTNGRDEKILTQKVAPLFKQDSRGQIAGVRYGRKLLKKKAGIRTSSPPRTGLTKTQAADVRSALGIEAKAPAKKATPAKK
jgi:hypothetical protein